MTSYKELYLEAVNPYETDFACPLCNAPIIVKVSQLYCANKDCTWNPTIEDILSKLYERVEGF